MNANATAAKTFSKLTGSYGAPMRRVGTIRTTTEIVERTSEETACNYDEITVPAGTEAVLQTNGYMVVAVFPGTITASSWTDRLFSSSTTKTDENVGKARNYVLHTYDYLAVQGIIAGTFLGGAEVVLDEGVTLMAEDVKLSTGMHRSFKFGVRA